MYLKEQNLAWIAKGENPIYLIPSMSNRHGLVAGATGTGKTVTIKVMAESFSDMGVPVFMADVKGDVSGMIVPGDKDGVLKFLDKCSVPQDSFDCKPYPSRFWDVYGDLGHNIRTTVSEFGPGLLARLLELSEVQAGVLTIVFKVADEKGWLLIDLKDLKAMLKYVSDNAAEIRSEYGNVSPQSIGAIQRSLLKLEEAGGNIFFGEPNLDIFDWMQNDENGNGYINILECAKLVQSPLLYSTFLLWMLSELYERLPEAGDLEKPKIVFFFDEAHLLFDDAPKALLSKVEQIVRLIRSKGVGVYFISQRPADIPESILAQLGNRIQHALRAYTPQEQKAIKIAAQSFRENPAFDTVEVITQLGTGEALVSFLDADGVPMIVDKARILPPQSSMKIADELLVKQNIAASPYNAKYATSIDRESAYEIIKGVEAKNTEKDLKKAEKAGNKTPDEDESAVNILTNEQLEKEKQKAIDEALKKHQREDKEREAQRKKEEKEREKEEKARAKEMARLEKELEREKKKKKTSRRSKSNTVLTKTVNTATNTIGRELGKSITRGILGGIKNIF